MKKAIRRVGKAPRLEAAQLDPSMEGLQAFIRHCDERAKYFGSAGFGDLAQKTSWMANKAKDFIQQSYSVNK